MKNRLSFAITASLLTVTLLVSGLAARRLSQPLAAPLKTIDSDIQGWTAFEEQTLPPYTLKALDATEYLSRSYRKQDWRLDLFVAYYAQQRDGETMHSPKHCLPGSGWEIWQIGSLWIPWQGTKLEINRYSIQYMGTRMIMYYWYQSNARVFASEYLGKFLLARDTLLTGQTAGSIVRITLPDRPSADQEAIGFASELIPDVWRCFGRTSNSR